MEQTGAHHHRTNAPAHHIGHLTAGYNVLVPMKQVKMVNFHGGLQSEGALYRRRRRVRSLFYMQVVVSASLHENTCSKRREPEFVYVAGEQTTYPPATFGTFHRGRYAFLRPQRPTVWQV